MSQEFTDRLPPERRAQMKRSLHAIPRSYGYDLPLMFMKTDPLLPPDNDALRRACAREANRGDDVEDAPEADAKARGLSSHAVVIVGYDDADAAFEFKNSWGEKWRDDGYGKMGYSFLRRFATSFWNGEPIVAYRRVPSGSFYSAPHPGDTPAR